MSSINKVLKALPDIFSLQSNDYSEFVIRVSVKENMQQRWVAIGNRISDAIEKDQGINKVNPSHGLIKELRRAQKDRIEAYKHARKKALMYAFENDSFKHVGKTAGTAGAFMAAREQAQKCDIKLSHKQGNEKKNEKEETCKPA